MFITKELARTLVKRVRQVAKPERIIVFGSAVTKKMNRDSDIDLLILEHAARVSKNESVRIHEAIGNIGYPIDIIVMPSRQFDRYKNYVGGIEYPAHKFGKIIYEATPKTNNRAH